MPTRPATLADVDAIARVHVAGWHETYRGLMPDAVLDGLEEDERAKMWLRVLSGAHGVWVATDAAGAVVGFAAGGASRSADLPFMGELSMPSTS